MSKKRIKHIIRALFDNPSFITSLFGKYPISHEYIYLLKQAKLGQQCQNYCNIQTPQNSCEYLGLLKQAKLEQQCQNYCNIPTPQNYNSRKNDVYVLTVRIDDYRETPFVCRAEHKKEHSKIKGYWNIYDYKNLFERLDVALREADAILKKHDKLHPSMKENIVVCIVGSEYSLYTENGKCVPIRFFFQELLPKIDKKIKSYDSRITLFPGTIPVGASTILGNGNIDVYMSIAIQAQCGKYGKLSWKAKQQKAFEDFEVFNAIKMVSNLNELAKLGVKVYNNRYEQENHFLVTTNYGKKVCFLPSICIEYIYGESVKNAYAFLDQNPGNPQIPVVEILISSTISDSAYQFANLRIHADSYYSNVDTIKILSSQKIFSPHRLLCKNTKSIHKTTKHVTLKSGKKLEISSFTPVQASQLSVPLLRHITSEILKKFYEEYRDFMVNPKNFCDI